MTPERAKLIRETWERCGSSAMVTFKGGGRSHQVIAHKPRPIVPFEAPELADHEQAYETLVFTYEVSSLGQRRSWHISCEGLELASGDR